MLNRKRLSSGRDPAVEQSPKQLKCPECGSSRVWKSGIRKTRHGDVQRYICRVCSLRFSESTAPPSPHRGKPSLENKTNVDLFGSYLTPNTNQLKANGLTSTCRVCVSDAEMKNLVEVAREKAQREGTKPDLETMKGLIAQFMAWLDREGHKSSGYLNRIQRLAILHANLLDPEDVKKVIAEQDWKDSVKCLTVCAYDAFTRMLNIEWSPPRYKPEEALPFIPEKSELEQLIAACRSRRMAAFLQTLMETFADPGEALKLRWIDVDNKNRIITINRPVKGHNPRQLEVSGKLIAMLNSLPRKSKLIFPTSYANMQSCFLQVRKRAARVLLNPRLLEIHFTTFRHWGGSMIAYYTHGNVLTVQKLLGHKSIKNTMKYIHMIHFKDDEFETATATTVQESEELAAVGFEKFDEFKGIHIYRRPKRFMRYAQH